MIVSSSKTFSGWAEIFGDPVAAAAMVDRLVQHAEVLVLKCDSYRLRGKGQDVLTESKPRRTVWVSAGADAHQVERQTRSTSRAHGFGRGVGGACTPQKSPIANRAIPKRRYPQGSRRLSLKVCSSAARDVRAHGRQ